MSRPQGIYVKAMKHKIQEGPGIRLALEHHYIDASVIAGVRIIDSDDGRSIAIIEGGPGHPVFNEGDVEYVEDLADSLKRIAKWMRKYARKGP